MTRKNSTCSARLCKGREEGLEEFGAICKTNATASAQPVQLASAVTTRGHAGGATSSLAHVRCHHNSSCSKGTLRMRVCPEGFLVNADRFTPLQAGNGTEHGKKQFTVSLAQCPAKRRA